MLPAPTTANAPRAILRDRLILLPPDKPCPRRAAWDRTRCEERAVTVLIPRGRRECAGRRDRPATAAAAIVTERTGAVSRPAHSRSVGQCEAPVRERLDQTVGDQRGERALA